MVENLPISDLTEQALGLCIISCGAVVDFPQSLVASNYGEPQPSTKYVIPTVYLHIIASAWDLSFISFPSSFVVGNCDIKKLRIPISTQSHNRSAVAASIKRGLAFHLREGGSWHVSARTLRSAAQEPTRQGYPFLVQQKIVSFQHATIADIPRSPTTSNPPSQSSRSHESTVMARPFDESMHYQQMGSSMSSQTLLSGGRVYKTQPETSYSSLPHDGSGQSWITPHLTKDVSRKGPKPRLPKIKSSPSHGSLASARASHAKTHRRGKSATSPTSPTFVPDYLLQSSSSIVPASAHADPYASPERKSSSKSKTRIKPLLRKFTSQENVTIDLSRSAAENKGLGIYSSSEINIQPPSAAAKRGFHNHTASGASELSTNTMLSTQHGASYVHPMRQTPQSHTPPIANSYKTSLESEAPTISTSSDAAFFDSYSRQPSTNTVTTPTPYAPLPSTRRPPPLHVRTGSASRLTSSSQTNLPGTPSSLRFNTDTITPSDMVSPTARSSLESAFRKRSRSNTANTSNDPVTQAATVQQMRRQFQEKEAAKELKYQQAEARAQEKEAKRREKRDQSERRTSEKRERKRAQSNAASEKSSFLATSEQREAFPAMQGLSQSISLPGSSQQRTRGDTAGSAGKAARSKWSLFWFRMTTMWLTLKRKMFKSSVER